MNEEMVNELCRRIQDRIDMHEGDIERYGEQFATYREKRNEARKILELVKAWADEYYI